MPFEMDRRYLLQLGAFGAGALSIPGTSAAIAAASGFTHGVASGEPSQTSVLLWTRFVGTGETRLAAEISESESFDRLVNGSEAVALPDTDYTAKTVVSGLAPGRWYFYRFRAPGGEVSPIGRTRTLPDGATAQFRLGIFSCANLPFGWFNAYAHAAERQDLDLIVHVGDYLYEYERSKYPATAALLGRTIEPAGETIHLTDYRLRHSSYRADPDLRRLMQNFPWIAMWDDHEIANDCWHGGAGNHQPGEEGSWDVRKTAAIRAFREWMPVSDATYVEYRIGDLATLFRPETRVTGRSLQLDVSDALKGASDPRAALIAFRDDALWNSSRTLMGAEQEWRLAEGLRRSASAGISWQVLAQQVVMGSIFLPPDVTNWLPPALAGQSNRIGLLASLGIPLNLDNWGGYPAARARLLKSAQEANANLIVLSGDSHNAWAFELAQDRTPAGVEFAGQSVTSPGYEAAFARTSPRDVERAMMNANRQLKWANTERRGYLTVELTPDRATSEWLMLDTVRHRSTLLAGRHSMSVERGTNRLS